MCGVLLMVFPYFVSSAWATVIASQAMITGAFSVTKQAVQLGYLPRLQMKHTSVRETGQIDASTIAAWRARKTYF